jgi:hypothetical protein
LQHPDSDDSFAHLKAAGWSVGEVGTATGWLVCGWNGENVLRASGATLAEAYRRACDQAGLCGMLQPHSRPPWQR